MAEYAIGVARLPDAHGSVPGVTFRDKADIADLPLPAKDGDMARKMAVLGTGSDASPEGCLSQRW